MPSRKRTREEVESSDSSIPEPGEELSTLQRIRGMWEFAAFMQYLFFFGKAVKIEDLDVEDFEDECLKPGPSEKLSQIALALLKNVSSHKGLTPEILDEYTRRQYVAKAPKRNPFGEEDEPRKFAEFDIFTKIRVLQQLATWTLNNPNPIREKLGESENEQATWRIEPFGWDKEDRVYFVLDDNRLYRRTDAPPPPDLPPPRTPKKSKAKKSNGRATRSAKRQRVGRRVVETSPEETEDEDVTMTGVEEIKKEPAADEFSMQRWELVAVSMDEFTDFVDSIKKSKDANERALVKAINSHVMPLLEEMEEERKRKEARRMKELEMMQKLATSKRSSRLADKQEKVKADQEAAEAEAKRKADLAMAHREQKKAEEMEHARESRRETREQRLKDREVKRILLEEQQQKEQEMLQRMETEGVVVDPSRGRVSERQLKSDMQKRKAELEDLQPEDDWYFDCICGKHGQNLDDGTHSIACDKCNTWQHSKCNGIEQAQAEHDDFHFVCKDCKRKEENPVKLKLKMASSPASSPAPKPKKTKTKAEVHIPAPGRAPLPPNAANGALRNPAGNLIHPGPPPQPPMSNGNRPYANGASPQGPPQPTQFQWHQYQPYQVPNYHHSNQPFGYQQAPPPHQAYQQPPPPGQYQQQIPAYNGAPPRVNYQHPQSISPRPTSSHQMSPSQQAVAPRPAQSPPAPGGLPHYQGSPAPSLQAPAGSQSPSKRPPSSGYGRPGMAVANGSHQGPSARALGSSPPPPPLPHPPARTPAAAPPSQPMHPTLTPGQPGQGRVPANMTPGYSPTKQPSPKLPASSPQPPPMSSPPVVSPPNNSLAHFSPPKQTAVVSPIKHASSSPQQAPPVADLGASANAPASQMPSLGHTPSLTASFGSASGGGLPAAVPAPMKHAIPGAPNLSPKVPLMAPVPMQAEATTPPSPIKQTAPQPQAVAGAGASEGANGSS